MFKHTKKILASIFILAGITLFISCQEEPTVVTPAGGQRNLSKVSTFVMPVGATLVIANLKLYSYQWEGNSHNVDIHSVTKNWLCPSWDSIYADYNPTIIKTFDMSGVGTHWESIDISATVQAWLNGDPNYGLLLKNHDTYAGANKLGHFLSNDWSDPTLRPYLEIVTTAGTFEVEPSADTYIHSYDAYLSYCTNELLSIGYIDLGAGLQEKRPLIRFDITPTPGGGCTLTPGYWKTHSEFGPAPYDDTWAQLPNGASTTFFFSEKSYYQVLWTAPRGNAYYILAHAYIAAKLNKLNGADFTAAQAAFTAATVLFSNPINTPAYIGSLKGNNPVRQQFISLAGILDNYNNGIIGPGHCD